MFANSDKENQPNGRTSTVKTYAVLLSLMLQLATCTVVFGLLGRWLALQWNQPYITAVGIIFGLLVGLSGFAFLAKQLLQDKPKDKPSNEKK